MSPDEVIEVRAGLQRADEGVDTLVRLYGLALDNRDPAPEVTAALVMTSLLLEDRFTRDVMAPILVAALAALYRERR